LARTLAATFRSGQRVGMGMTDDAAFSAFVSARSAGLLRTAYLLTHDEGLAEDLLQTALTKTWFAWGRLDETRSAMCAGCW